MRQDRAYTAQNINKHYGLVHKIEIGRSRMPSCPSVAGRRSLDTEICVCMQHNEANTIIYKTPVGDMDFRSLSTSVLEINFQKYISLENAVADAFYARPVQRLSD